MVLFILFPGLGINKKIWELTHNNKKLIKLNFLNELKKIGDVYTYTPNVYKFEYYKQYDGKIKKLENEFKEKPNDISLNQMNIRKECERIYDEVKSYKGKFIPIGHSAGGWFAYKFTKMYKKRCEKLILIESGYITKDDSQKLIKFKTNNKNYDNITNIDLQKLTEKIIKHNNNKELFKKLYEIIVYKYNKTMGKLNGKVYCPTLFFENINISDKEHNETIEKYQKELYKINGNKIQFINMINTGHFPWEIPEYSYQMIKQIKCFV